MPPAATPTISPLRHVIETNGPGAYGLKALAECVGGIDALEDLDIEPHPLEPFDAGAVAAAHRSLVVGIHEALAAGIEAFNRPFASLRTAKGLEELPLPFNEEFQAIAQRILLRLARADVRVLGTSTPGRVAAAIAWVAYRGSQFKRGRRSVVTADGLWRAFGVSNCAPLASRLYRALRLPSIDADDCWYQLSSLWLPDTQLLHSTSRIRLLRNRSTALRVAETLAQQEAERRPIQFLTDGKVQVRARPVVPFNALRGADTTGRLTVVAVFGNLEAPEVIGLSVPDARRLVAMLQHALDGPVSRSHVQV